MKQEKPVLNRLNRLFAHLLITPFATLIYYPLNKNIVLPTFGSGAPYTAISGKLVDRYFSANHFTLITAVCLLTLTVILSVRLSRSIRKPPVRILYLTGCILMGFLTFICFLEFSLWSS